MELKHAAVTDAVIGLFYQVYRTLGYGFLERVYANAMALAGRKRGLVIVQEAPIRVHFEGAVIGKCYPDLIVNDSVIAELKACKNILPEHEAQLLNYLKASRFEVGLVLNFGPRSEFKRLVLENERKGGLSWVENPVEESGKNQLDAEERGLTRKKQ